jgi:ABC-type transport system involved in Fe-S cluster assembly fused permease/ATPase subunit
VVKCSEALQCSDGLSDKVSNIIRRHTDNMGLLLVYNLLLSHSFIFNIYMVVFLFNTVINVFYCYVLSYVYAPIVCLCIHCMFIVPAGTPRLP